MRFTNPIGPLTVGKITATITNPTTTVGATIKNPTTTVGATIKNPTTTVGATIKNPTTTVGVKNVATTVVQTGNKWVTLGNVPGPVTVNSTGYTIGIASTKIAHTFSCVMVRATVALATRAKLECATVRSVNSWGSASFGDHITHGTTVDSSLTAIIPAAVVTGETLFITLYAATIISVVGIFVLGLSQNPGILVRADGRAYPLGRYLSHVGGTTGVLIAAPLAPARILLASLDGLFQGSSATTTAGLNIFGVINGATTRVLRMSVDNKSPVKWSKPLPPSGQLLDPGQALKFATVLQLQNTMMASYDIVV